MKVNKVKEETEISISDGKFSKTYLCTNLHHTELDPKSRSQYKSRYGRNTS